MTDIYEFKKSLSFAVTSFKPDLDQATILTSFGMSAPRVKSQNNP